MLKKDILTLGESPTEGLGGLTLTAEKNILLIKLHYNGANSYLFVSGAEIIKLKAKDSDINRIILCLGNISKDFFVDNMKKILWFYG